MSAFAAVAAASAAGSQLASLIPGQTAAAAAATPAEPRTRSIIDATSATPTSSAPLVKAGLYSYGYDYLCNRSLIQGLGSTALRTSNAGMYQAAYAAMQADALDTHVTISGTDRSKFTCEADWIADYLKQVDAYLSLYPVSWVEVWNEPNFGMWAGATAAQKQLAYGHLLVAAYSHIKSNWAGVGVAGFAAGDASAAAPGFIKGVLAAVPAAATSFDVCSLHPYFGSTAPEATKVESWGSWTIAGQVAAVRKLGITTPIWFTEVGYAIAQSDGGKYAQSAGSTVSPALQAAYRVRMHILCMKLGVARVNHMYVIDTDNYNGGFFSAGLARPQATAFAQQQKMIGTATSIAPLVEGPVVWAYRITTPTGSVVAAWSDTEVALPSLGLTFSSGADGLGNAVSTVAGVLQLASMPVFLSVASPAASSSSTSTEPSSSSAPVSPPKRRPSPTKSKDDKPSARDDRHHAHPHQHDKHRHHGRQHHGHHHQDERHAGHK